jgi:hypothetical protein
MIMKIRGLLWDDCYGNSVIPRMVTMGLLMVNEWFLLMVHSGSSMTLMVTNVVNPTINYRQ